MSVGSGCWSSPVPPARGAGLVCPWADGAGEGRAASPGSPGLGPEPGTAFTSPCWGSRCRLWGQGFSEGQLRVGVGVGLGTAQQGCAKGSTVKSSAAGTCCSAGNHARLGNTGTACGGFGCPCCQLWCHPRCSSEGRDEPGLVPALLPAPAWEVAVSVFVGSHKLGPKPFLSIPVLLPEAYFSSSQFLLPPSFPALWQQCGFLTAKGVPR